MKEKSQLTHVVKLCLYFIVQISFQLLTCLKLSTCSGVLQQREQPPSAVLHICIAVNSPSKSLLWDLDAL